MELKNFIEVTCLADGLRAMIRSDNITSVYEVGEENDDGAIRPRHTSLFLTDGSVIRVSEDYDDVLNKIWKSEL